MLAIITAHALPARTTALLTSLAVCPDCQCAEAASKEGLHRVPGDHMLCARGMLSRKMHLCKYVSIAAIVGDAYIHTDWLLALSLSLCLYVFGYVCTYMYLDLPKPWTI